MFKIGTKIVYPGHGIGVIESIEERKVSGTTQIYNVIRIIGNGTTIMIPESNVKKVGLRGIINKKDVPRVVKILNGKSSSNKEENWNRRYRDYLEKLKTGSVFEIAEVFRDIYQLKSKKELSFGEKQVLDNARQLIFSEIAEAKGVGEKKAEKIMENWI